ncbi:MAG: hypothetical protein K2F87_00815 [Muribaculaceae bacterium]|nr:hypothetical protein [Muribaculaceae bacterium]
MAKREKSSPAAPPQGGIEKRRKRMEATATFGLILIAVALIAPFASFMAGKGDPVIIQPSAEFTWADTYKWIYAAGALIFTFARLVNVSDTKESLRIRRIRRLEFWAGMAFCIGAFFWFYNTRKLSGMLYVGQMAILRDTVVFSLAGAMIQIVASWMLVWRQRKEAAEQTEKPSKKSGD